MFDPPFDAPLVLVALALAAATCFGAATALAPTPPADAAGIAATVDRVAASDVPTATTHATGADAVKVGPRRVWTRTDARTASATYATGPVTPVTPDTRLARVLDGEPPSHVFDAPRDLVAAAAAARNRTPRWHRRPSRVRARLVTWRGTSVTLVG